MISDNNSSVVLCINKIICGSLADGLILLLSLYMMIIYLIRLNVVYSNKLRI